MKKMRIITIVLSVALVLAGAGYAAWTDRLTINTSVQTGKLDVNFKDGSVTWNNDNEGVAGGYVTVREDGNTASVTLNNLYPGAAAIVNILVKNDGTIPVKNGTFSLSTDVPSWLKVEINNGAETLKTGEEKNVIINVSVPKEETGHQNETVTFSLSAVYQQFNV